MPLAHLILVCLIGFSGHASGQLQEMTRAEYLASSEPIPPVSMAWQPVQLPYAPRGEGHIPNPGAIWFRFRVPASPDAQAVYIGRHNVSLEVFLDDLRVGGQWQAADPPPIGWNRPTLVDLPAKAQAAFIYIRLQSGPYGSMLAAPLVGPANELHSRYRARYFWQVEVSQWMFLLSVTVGGFALLLWYFRRQESLYLLFAGAAGGWALVTLYLFLDFIPITLKVWLGIIHTGATWTTWFLVTFMLGAADRRLPHLEKGLLVVSILATVFHFVYPANLFFEFAYAFHALGILVLLGVGVLFIGDALKRPGGSSTWFALAFLVFFLLAAHDWYFFILSPDDQYTEASNLIQLGIPVLLLVLFLNLVTRFARALNETERLNQNLEARVQEHKRALDESYERNRQMEIAAAAAAQREKIYRDLHDDVGARLTSIIYTSKESTDVQLAREALEGLRESIYRANYTAQGLDEFVDQLVDETRLRVESAGLQFTLSLGELPTQVVAAETCYQVMRICRELVSNVLHHARAGSVTLSVAADQANIICEISDDGIGMTGEPVGHSGISGVRARAGKIGATIDWASAPGCGTRATLVFPL
ncbi:MAG: ATP-binding protein [Pseudomonadota bacterium]